MNSLIESCSAKELVYERMKGKWILNRDSVLVGKRVRKGTFSLGTMSGCLRKEDRSRHTQEFISKNPMSHLALFKAILNPCLVWENV